MSHDPFNKRLFDIFAAVLAFVALFPLFVFIWIALRLEGEKGPLLYCGERIGRSGRHFKCWKIRTMAQNSDHLLKDYLQQHPEMSRHWETYFKLPDDPRVTTKTGYFLRKTSLDELPQFLECINRGYEPGRPTPYFTA